MYKQSYNNGNVERYSNVKGRKFWGVSLLDKDYRQLMTAGRKTISLFLELSTPFYWLYNAEWSSLKPHIHKQLNQIHQVVFTYMRVAIIVREQ